MWNMCATRELTSRDLSFLVSGTEISCGKADAVLMSSFSKLGGFWDRFLQEKDAHHLKSDEKQEQFSQTSCLSRLLTHFMLILCLIFFHYDLQSIYQRREKILSSLILFKFRDVI